MHECMCREASYTHLFCRPSGEIASAAMPKTSCEKRRTSAYSPELRWRIVWQRKVLGYQYEAAPSHLNVHIATVWRTIKLFRETGSIDKRAYPKHQIYQKITTPLEYMILHSVLERRGI